MGLRVVSGISFRKAVEEDVPVIAALRSSVAESLTRQFGKGHWSSLVTEANVARGLRTSEVLVATANKEIVGTLRLATKKPWAIDVTYFQTVRKPLYLHDMAVVPSLQRQGIGRSLLEEARRVATAWPSEAIRLDAYDAAAGAGQFYAKCGFKEVGRKVYRGVPLVYFELILE
jgi:GNAT superfamily N-acetyltransferase